MGRIVDSSRPYTDEEKAYLLTRSGGEGLISVNDRKFSHLTEENRAILLGRTLEDEEKEKKIEEQLKKIEEDDEKDSYHEDDIEYVEDLTVAQLRAALEKEGLSPVVSKADRDDGSDDPLTEKEVLVYRLLNRLDQKRNAAK